MQQALRVEEAEVFVTTSTRSEERRAGEGRREEKRVKGERMDEGRGDGWPVGLVVRPREALAQTQTAAEEEEASMCGRGKQERCKMSESGKQES